MAKLLICFFFYMGIVINLFSQEADSVINIKGYYVTRFLKDEISFSYNQKINKINGESYSTPIDYRTVSFFIPLSIDGHVINHMNDLANIISCESNLHKDSIYYLPVSKQSEKYIKEATNLDVILSKEICIFSEVGRISPYYINTNTDKYLYKIMFINGEVLKATVMNTARKRAYLGLDIDNVNKNSPSIELFFIIKINSYSTILNNEGLKEWVPYCEKE